MMLLASFIPFFSKTADKSSSSQVGQSTWSMTSAGATNPSSSNSPVPPGQSGNAANSASSSAANHSSSSAPALSTHKLGPILEMALLKAPALNLKAGNNMVAINRFRAMLQAEESESTKVG